MASTKATVTSFEQAERFLAGGRSKTSRNLANNTYVERRDEDTVAIRLHATDVVTFHRDGRIVLNTGGWRTVTTKDRLCNALSWPVQIFSIKGQWRLKVSNSFEVGTSVPFADGITIQSDGEGGYRPVEGTYPDATDEEKQAEARKALNKAVKKYLDKAVKEFFPKWQAELRETRTLNTAGDPWCCLMGIGGQDTDHLWTHLREGYVFPTIVRKALEDSGKYPDPIDRFAKSLAYGLFDHLSRDLRKYLLKHLDPSVTAAPTGQVKVEQWVDQAREALTRPSDYAYYGHDEDLYTFSAPTFTRHRDSDYIENANFEIVWEGLVESFPDLVQTGDRLDERPGGIYVHRAGHWAVGWIEQIVVPVHKDKRRTLSADNLHPAFIQVAEAAEATRLYPALPGAEERAAKDEWEAVRKDLKGWLEYQDRQDGDDRWQQYLAPLTEYYNTDNYPWSLSEIVTAAVEHAEEEAYIEHHIQTNRQIDGQETLL
jgi:hypothetical protein